jgi:hypothetical protein
VLSDPFPRCRSDHPRYTRSSHYLYSQRRDILVAAVRKQVTRLVAVLPCTIENAVRSSAYLVVTVTRDIS